MVFSLPQLLELAAARATFCWAKPLPVAAAARFYRERRAPDDGTRIQWLVDTPQRLAQYRDLARQQDLQLG